MNKPMFLNKIFKKKKIVSAKFPKPVLDMVDSSVASLQKGQASDPIDTENININDDIFFNPLTSCYIIYLKTFGKNVTISEQQIKSIFLAYSDTFGKPSTIEQVARMLKWTRPCAAELLKIFSANHKMLPVTPYELLNKNDEEIVDDIDAHRRFVLQQKIEHKAWNDIKEESLKWREFQYNVVFPIELFLQTWEPPKLQVVKVIDYKADDTVLLISLNDLHIGAKTEAAKAFSGKDFNTEIAVESVRNYISQVKGRLENRKTKPKKAVILFNGDIVHSFADNFTRRGTELNSEYVNEDLFKIALNLIIDLVWQVAGMFKEVEVIVGKGNHDSHVALYLGMAAEKCFLNEKSIKFDVESKWIFSRWVNNVFCLISHGVHDTYKNIGIPKTKEKLQNFVNNYLVEKAEEVSTAGQKILVIGHLHSLYFEDFGSFRVYRFGSGVASEEHSQALGHFTPPYQNCLLIGKNKVEEVWDIYL